MSVQSVNPEPEGAVETRQQRLTRVQSEARSLAHQEARVYEDTLRTAAAQARRLQDYRDLLPAGVIDAAARAIPLVVGLADTVDIVLNRSPA